MTKDELQAKVVEATLGGGLQKCIVTDCKRKYVSYDAQTHPTLYWSVGRCPWCLRKSYARLYDSMALSETSQRKLDRLTEDIARIDEVIKEQEWVLWLPAM